MGLIQQYGLLAVAVVLAFLAGRGVVVIIRAWSDGAFFSKSFVDQLLAAKDDLYREVVERYKASQDAVRAWRDNSDRVLRVAEAAQDREKEILVQLAALRAELDRGLADVRREAEELRGDVDDLRADVLERPRPPRREEPGRAPERPPERPEWRSREGT